MSADNATLISLRTALMAGQREEFSDLLDSDPSLVDSRPWGDEWDVTAVEAAATICVHHRPAAYDMVRMLLERGADCSLQTAARGGQLDVVRGMLDTGDAKLNALDEQGRSALYRAACVFGQFNEGQAVVDELLDRGANVDLHSACTLGLFRKVQSLIEKDPASARLSSPEGMTALHWAMRVRRYVRHAAPITSLILQQDVDVHAPNPTEDDMQAIHHVAEWSGQPEQVQQLIDHGANINAKARNGWSPLDYALDRGRKAIAECLESKGAKRSGERPE